MTAKTATPAVPAQLTHAERLARKLDAQRKRFNRDRARMLSHVQSCIQQAGAAIAAGDIARHDEWLDATDAAIASYRKFVALSAPTQAQASDSAPTVAG